MAIFFDLVMLIIVIVMCWFAYYQIIFPVLNEIPMFWIFSKEGREIVKELEIKKSNNLTKELEKIKRGRK